MKKQPEEKEKSNLKPWLFFAGFVIWVTISSFSDVHRASLINENNDALECIIQQMSEHRINNRSAHDADSKHHEYEYEIGPDNIPTQQINLPEDVCDKWLTRPKPETGGIFSN